MPIGNWPRAVAEDLSSKDAKREVGQQMYVKRTMEAAIWLRQPIRRGQ
jgi:hypothetical protein